MTNLSIDPADGSSVGLQRWLDVLRGGLRSTTDGVGAMLSGATHTGATERVGPLRLPWSLDHTERATTQAVPSSATDVGRRTSRAALDAHAAAGELAAQRAAYASLERAVALSDAAVRQHLDRVQAAPANPGRADADRREATRVAESTARAERSETRSARVAAGLDAANEVAAGRDRLVELRDRALAQAAEVTVVVNALADDVARDNRRIAERQRAASRAQDRIDAARADAAEAAQARTAAAGDTAARVEADQVRERRDQAVRELARLTGATATAGTDGALEVRIEGRPVVDADGAHPVSLRAVPVAAASPVATESRVAESGAAGGAAGRERAALDSVPAAATRPETDAHASPVLHRSELRADPATPMVGPPAPQGPGAEPPLVPRLLTADGTPVQHPGGRIAALLDHATKVVPDALSRWEQVGAAVATAVAAATVIEPTATPAPRTPTDGVGAEPRPAELPSMAAALQAAQSTLAQVSAVLQGRAEVAERRLDVMSVVDAVLVGAPISQVGGLVSTALGVRSEAAASAGRSGQNLVTALQALDAVTTAMGRTARGAATDLTQIPLAVTSSDPATLTAEPGSVTPPGSPETPRGPADRLPWAVDEPEESFVFGPGEPMLPPSLGFDGEVAVLSVARATAVASNATFDPAARFGGPLTLGLTVTAAGTPSREVVTVPAGAGIHDVADAITAAGVGVRAAVVPVGDGTVRLMLATEQTGSDVTLGVSDGHLPGRASDLIGAFSTVQRGADTVLALSADGEPERTVSSSTRVVDDAVPGTRLIVGGQDDPENSGLTSTGIGDPGATSPAPATDQSVPSGAPVHLTVRPDAAVAAQHAAAMVAGAAAVLDTIRGRGAVPPPVAAVLAHDPVVGVVATQLSSALMGNAENDHGAQNGQQLPGRGGHPGTGALPGLRMDTHDQVRFDARTFGLAFTEDSGRVAAQLRAVAEDLFRVATDATDPRSGALAVRILSEQSLAQEYSQSTQDVDDRSKHRQDVLEGRAAAMTSLLERLGAEQRWLDLHLQH